MQIVLKILQESISQAWGQLIANKLRSFLSLLGIAIGIFCIIGVKSAVDSMEDNIRKSFEKLGNDVIYLSKVPWGEDPGDNWWKYQRRPNPSFSDLEAIQRKAKFADKAAFSLFIGGKTIKFLSNTVERAFTIGVTYEYAEIFKLKFGKGRYYTPNEYQYGTPGIILGANVAEKLFGNIEPIGKEVSILGHKLQIIGVIEKGGKSLIDPLPFDDCILMSYKLAQKVVNVRNVTSRMFGTSLNVKVKEGYSVELLKDELTSILRAERRLKPVEESNFSLNELSVLGSLLDNVFGALNVAGLVIGGFALLVGMFSVANIMFVSVKERTGLIGIKKAIGAKSYMIILEFLIESVILCIIGGLFGVLFIFGVAQLLSMFLPFPVNLSIHNVIIAVTVSIIVGILSGLIPAIQAARMDPVEAIRKG